MTQTDRIEKNIQLSAPKARVWSALTNAVEFGAWFGVALDSDFSAGGSVTGSITHAGYEHLTFEIIVEQMDTERLFSFRWHPYAVDPKIDYSGEPTTLVEFRLEEVADGTLLTLVESGFDRVPEYRRVEAYRMNSQGWTIQLENVERHVTD